VIRIQPWDSDPLKKNIFGRRLGMLAVVAILLLVCWFSTPVAAQRNETANDAQIERATELAAKTINPGNEQLQVDRRKDLEELLSGIDQKRPAAHVYFYEMQPASRTSTDIFTPRVVAVTPATEGVFELYDFHGSNGSDDSSREFNRLTSTLTLSIAEAKATSFARLYLAACDAAEFGQMVRDEDELRTAVENYYYGIFNNELWRTLSAYVWWWRGYQRNAPSLAPVVKLGENGSYNILVKKLIIPAGQHPEVQQLELEISHEGKVRVVTTQLLFPPEPRWLFYDTF